MAFKGCNNKIKGICSLISAVLINLLTGSLFTFPNLISYYEVFVDHKFNKNQLYFVAPVGILFFNSLSSVMGILDDKLGTRILNIIASILLLSSQLLVYFFKVFALLIIAYILYGLAASLTYYQSLKNCWKYFPNLKGLVSGIVFSSFGLGPFIFTSIADGVIKTSGNEGNKAEEIIKGFKLYLIIFLICIAVAGALSSILCFPYKKEDKYLSTLSVLPSEENEDQSPKEEKEREYSVHLKDEDKNEEKNEEKKGEKNGDEKTLKETILSKDFLFCLLIAACTLTYGYLLSNTYRTFGEVSFINENEKASEEEKTKMKGYLQTLSKLFTLLNTFGRLIWGFIADRVRFKILYSIVCVIQIISGATIYFSAGNMIAYYIFTNLGVLGFAGHVIVFPNLIPIKFGVEKSVYLLGICAIFTGIAALIGPILTLFVLKEKKDYLIIYLVGSAPTIVSLLITIFIKVETKPKEEPKIIEENIYGEEKVIKKENEEETEIE